ncbi:MAG: penicillin-binding protein 2, partial [Candidatus Hinthialibacter sp.]
MKRNHIALFNKTNKVERRIKLFMLLIVGFFAVLVFRLWTIQIYRQEDYLQSSLNNMQRLAPIQSIRGEIRDSNGKILAKDVNYHDVWIKLNYKNSRRAVTPDVQKSLEMLSDILGKSYKRLEYDYLHKTRDPFYKRLQVCVANRIPPHQYVILEERKMEFPEEAMIFARKVPTRYYHYNSLAAHILGLTGPIDANEKNNEEFADYAPYSLVGKSGIEKQYESYLHGSDGLNRIIVDKNEIQRSPSLEVKAAVPGNNIVLNLVYEYQFAAERILGASAGVIIVSTTDNRLLAMASNPRYDLNEYRKKYGVYLTDPLNPFYHRAVSGKYEPGSVFKIYEAFALLEELKISPEHKVYCPGYFSQWATRWNCHKKTGHGYLNLYEAICLSCNVYFYEMVGAKLNIPGGRRLRKWAIEFGFEDKTGVDLPDEPSPSAFPSKDTERALNFAYTPGVGVNNAIGQGGVLFSPLQVHTAACAIVNNGVLYQPQVAQKILSHGGEVIKTFEPMKAGMVNASTKTFQTVRKAMWEVVNHPRGTGRQLKDYPNFTVAGKTGTAQAGNRGEPHAWFVCFGPYENPEIVITVMIENGGHGGEV